LQARVRDPASKAYISRTFDADAKAAMDAWTKDTLAGVRLHLQTGQRADAKAISNAWLAQLGSSRPASRQVTQGHKDECALVLKSMVDFAPGLDLNAAGAGRTLASWVSSWRRADGERLAAGTSRRRVAVVRAMLRWAVRRELIKRDPSGTIEIQPEGRSVQPVLSAEEWRRVLALDEDKPRFRWFALMLLAGLRSAEACGVQWSDIAWEQRVLTVRRGKGANCRIVIMHHDLVQILARHRKDVGLVAWEKPPTRAATLRAFRGLLEAAGVEWDRGESAVHGRKMTLHPHSCRITNAAASLASGADSMLLMHMLGHAGTGMTSHYSRCAPHFLAVARDEGWAGSPRWLGKVVANKPAT
jgi:integrase